MAIRHDKKIAFVHIPKTAGVAVQKNFKMDGDGDHQVYKYYMDKYPGYLIFAIVRNPFDRLVSAYEFMKLYDKNPDKRMYQEHYKNGFDDFCRKLDKYDNGEWMNLIFKPQHEFICNGSIKTDRLFRFEDNFWKDLYKLFGEKVRPKYFNKTKHKHYSAYYTEETKKLIFDYYKDDFEIFNYI